MIIMMIFKNDNFIIFRKFHFSILRIIFNDETNLRVKGNNGCFTNVSGALLIACFVVFN